MGSRLNITRKYSTKVEEQVKTKEQVNSVDPFIMDDIDNYHELMKHQINGITQGIKDYNYNLPNYHSADIIAVYLSRFYQFIDSRAQINENQVYYIMNMRYNQKSNQFETCINYIGELEMYMVSELNGQQNDYYNMQVIIDSSQNTNHTNGEIMERIINQMDRHTTGLQTIVIPPRVQPELLNMDQKLLTHTQFISNVPWALLKLQCLLNHMSLTGGNAGSRHVLTPLAMRQSFVKQILLTHQYGTINMDMIGRAMYQSDSYKGLNFLINSIIPGSQYKLVKEYQKYEGFNASTQFLCAYPHLDINTLCSTDIQSVITCYYANDLHKCSTRFNTIITKSKALTQ